MKPDNDARNKTIARMLKDGYSYGEIAAILSITRNAVASVAHRLKTAA